MSEPDDDFVLDDEDEWDDEKQEWHYLKFAFDGAATLRELSAALCGFAAELERRDREGWRLGGPVDSGHVWLVWDGA